MGVDFECLSEFVFSSSTSAVLRTGPAMAVTCVQEGRTGPVVRTAVGSKLGLEASVGPPAQRLV